MSWLSVPEVDREESSLGNRICSYPRFYYGAVTASWRFNDELTSLEAELRRDAQMLTLNRMHELLQACTAQEEAYQVISLVAGELFTGQNGYLAISHASDRYLETVAAWGKEALNGARLFTGGLLGAEA